MYMVSIGSSNGIKDVIVANYVLAQWLMFTAHKSGNHATMALTKANPYYIA